MARVVSRLVLAVAGVSLAGLARADAPATAPSAPLDVAQHTDFESVARPLLKQYCYDCHGDGAKRGKLALDAFASVEDARQNIDTWAKVIQYARTHTMPPPSAEQPAQADRDRLVASLVTDLYQVDASDPDPGVSTVRRLNRAEYRNTIRDLIGVRFDPTIDFPQDDTGYGFDNIADVLTLPPMLMEKYLAAADRILNEAIPTAKLEHQERTLVATTAKPSFTMAADRVRDGWLQLRSEQEDTISIQCDSPAPAEYVVRVLAYATHDHPPPPGETEPKPMYLSVMLTDAVVQEIPILADATSPQWYEARVGVPQGRYTLRFSMRRSRGPVEDHTLVNGRLGIEQLGAVYLKDISIAGPATGANRRVYADRMQTTGVAGRQNDQVSLQQTNDEAYADVDFPSTGKYILRVQASAEYAGDEPARVELQLDDKPIGEFEIKAPARLRRTDELAALVPYGERAVPRVYELTTEVPAGKHRLAVRYLNNLLDRSASNPNYRDRNVYLHHFDVVEVSAPPLSQPMSDPMRKLFARYPVPIDDQGTDPAKTDAQARALLADFARRAWRRSVSDEDLARLMKLYAIARDNGENPRGAVKFAMKGMLVSPSFLFRGEAPSTIAGEKRAVPIGEFDLATRLSFFLWSSTPDDELLDLAARGQLRSKLDAQINRMLASNKSDAFVENFAGQWLQFRNLDAAHPDDKLFKAYDDRLRDAMKMETRLFFANILHEDRSLLDVLTADYTFVNPMLAKHYGLKAIKGDGFQKVSLDGTQRRGIITQGSVLTLTSTPTRTSPVKRGKWVLENLLGSAPPPPPPDIPALEANDHELKGTVRERMEQHRANKACASCHAPMDPIGFGLENFDAIGAWRDRDGKEKVDSASAFADGAKFAGPVELANLLATTRKGDFYRAVAEAALTYALGRGVTPQDQPAVDAIIARLNATNGKCSALIQGVIDSVPFQMQRSAQSPAAQRADVSITNGATNLGG